MPSPADIKTELVKPLDPKRIEKREGSGGRRLSYIATHDAIRTANRIFGEGEWGYEVVELVHLGTEPFTRNGKTGNRVGYRAVVKVSAIGSQFSDVGYGDAQEYTDSLITPHELAAKEAVSDAVKRCLKNYGDQFGLCLYDKDAPEHRGSAGEAGGGQSTTRAAAPSSGKASPAQVKRLTELVTMLVNSGKLTTAQFAAAAGIKPEVMAGGKVNQDAFAALATAKAAELIERLDRYAQANPDPPSFQAPPEALV